MKLCPMCEGVGTVNSPSGLGGQGNEMAGAAAYVDGEQIGVVRSVTFVCPTCDGRGAIGHLDPQLRPMWFGFDVFRWMAARLICAIRGHIYDPERDWCERCLRTGQDEHLHSGEYSRGAYQRLRGWRLRA